MSATVRLPCTIYIYLLLLLSLLFPVIEISEKHINLFELILYAIFILNLRKLTHLKTIFIHKAYMLYLVLYIIVVIIVSILSDTSISQDDIYVVRSIFQHIVALYLFYYLIFYHLKLQPDKINIFLIKCLLIFTLPAIIVYLQFFDILGFKELIRDLYKPAYFFLTFEELIDIRVTSVFKDHFTSSVYMIVISMTAFYLFLKVKITSLKLILLAIILLNYFAQLFTARTGLLLTPIAFILIYTFELKGISFSKNIKNIFLFILTTSLFTFLFYTFYIRHHIDSLTWAFEIFKLFDQSKLASFTSVTDMHNMNARFIEYLIENPHKLFLPNHILNREVYTDNFYLQEINRFGIYGIMIYILFITYLIFNSYKHSKFLLTIYILLIVLNYKGGNVFFLTKAIYIFSFIYIITLYYNNVVLKGSNASKNTIPHTTSTISTS